MLTGSECFRIGSTDVCLIYGDIITSTPFAEVLVNDAFEDLQPSGGMSERLSEEAGVSVQQECDDYIAEYGFLMAGDLFVSKGGSTIYQHIIHAVAPTLQKDCNGNSFIFRNLLKNTLVKVFRKAIELCAFGLTIPLFRPDSFACHCADICQAYFDAFLQLAETARTSYLSWIYIYDDNNCNLRALYEFIDRRVGAESLSTEELGKRSRRERHRDCDADESERCRREATSSVLERLAKRNEELVRQNQELSMKERLRLEEEALRFQQRKREVRERELNDKRLEHEKLLEETFEHEMRKAAREDAQFEKLFATTDQQWNEKSAKAEGEEFGLVKTESFTRDSYSDITTEDYFGNKTHMEEFEHRNTVLRTESFTKVDDRASRPKKVSIKSPINANSYISPHRSRSQRCSSCSRKSPCIPCSPSGQRSPCKPCSPSRSRSPYRKDPPCRRPSPCRPCSPLRTRSSCRPRSPCKSGSPRKEYWACKSCSPCKPCSPCRSCSPCRPCSPRRSCSPCRPCSPRRSCSPCRPCSPSRSRLFSPHRLVSPGRPVSPDWSLRARSRSVSPHLSVDSQCSISSRNTYLGEQSTNQSEWTQSSIFNQCCNTENNPKVNVPEPPIVQVIPTTIASKAPNKNVFVDDHMGQVYLSKIHRCDWADIEIHICQIPHEYADAVILVRDWEFVEHIDKACRHEKMKDYKVMSDCKDCNYLIFRIKHSQDDLHFIVIMAGPVVIDRNQKLTEEQILEFRKELNEILKKLIWNHQCLSFGLIIDHNLQFPHHNLRFLTEIEPPRISEELIQSSSGDMRLKTEAVALSRKDYFNRILNEFVTATTDIDKPK